MGRAALFDVDGALVATNHLHVTTWWEAFRQAGHDVAMHDIHHAIGLGSDDLVARLLGEDRDHNGDEALSAAHTTLYATYFERLPVLPGARDLLRVLAGRERRIVPATSAGAAELKALRRAIETDDVIAGVASADDVAEGKPAPDPVNRALELDLELAKAEPAEAVFVGDAVWDMKAARAADVRAVALLAGGIPRADLEEAGAQAVYGNTAELLTPVHQHFHPDGASGLGNPCGNASPAQIGEGRDVGAHVALHHPQGGVGKVLMDMGDGGARGGYFQVADVGVERRVEDALLGDLSASTTCVIPCSLRR